MGDATRTLESIGPTGNAATTECAHRDPEDDFFCLRYGVWYPSIDCAFRTHFRTAPGCLRCEQGRFNSKRHRSVVSRLRLASPPLRTTGP